MTPNISSSNNHQTRTTGGDRAFHAPSPENATSFSRNVKQYQAPSYLNQENATSFSRNAKQSSAPPYLNQKLPCASPPTSNLSDRFAGYATCSALTEGPSTDSSTDSSIYQLAELSLSSPYESIKEFSEIWRNILLVGLYPEQLGFKQLADLIGRLKDAVQLHLRRQFQDPLFLNKTDSIRVQYFLAGSLEMVKNWINRLPDFISEPANYNEETICWKELLGAHEAFKAIERLTNSTSPQLDTGEITYLGETFYYSKKKFHSLPEAYNLIQALLTTTCDIYDPQPSDITDNLHLKNQPIVQLFELLGLLKWDEKSKVFHECEISSTENINHPFELINSAKLFFPKGHPYFPVFCGKTAIIRSSTEDTLANNSGHNNLETVAPEALKEKGGDRQTGAGQAKKRKNRQRTDHEKTQQEKPFSPLPPSTPVFFEDNAQETSLAKKIIQLIKKDNVDQLKEVIVQNKDKISTLKANQRTRLIDFLSQKAPDFLTQYGKKLNP